jgi:hypothetical protein
MATQIWGPPAWKFMHSVTFAYPKSDPTEEDKENMVNFINACGRVLPCIKCRAHFRKMVRENPPHRHLQSRETISRWLVERHNDVNRRLNKPTLSYDYVRRQYEDEMNICKFSGGDQGEREKTDCNNVWKQVQNALLWVLIGCFILLFLFIIAYSVMRRNGKIKKP